MLVWIGLLAVAAACQVGRGRGPALRLTPPHPPLYTPAIPAAQVGMEGVGAREFHARDEDCSLLVRFNPPPPPAPRPHPPNSHPLPPLSKHEAEF